MGIAGGALWTGDGGCQMAPKLGKMRSKKPVDCSIEVMNDL
jgi:hypothetical protein